MAQDRPEDFPIRCDEPQPGEDGTWVLYGSGGCSLYDAADAASPRQRGRSLRARLRRGSRSRLAGLAARLAERLRGRSGGRAPAPRHNVPLLHGGRAGAHSRSELPQVPRPYRGAAGAFPPFVAAGAAEARTRRRPAGVPPGTPAGMAHRVDRRSAHRSGIRRKRVYGAHRWLRRAVSGNRRGPRAHRLIAETASALPARL